MGRPRIYTMPFSSIYPLYIQKQRKKGEPIKRINEICEGENMNLQLIYEPPTAEEYVSLRLRSGMGNKDLQRSQIALRNSLFTVSLYDKEKLIGFGRIVGDGGITYVVSDIMVDKEYQRKGFAEQIMKAIDSYFEVNTYEDSYICLIANHPADLLYHKHQFEYLATNKCGMLRNQGKNYNKG